MSCYWRIVQSKLIWAILQTRRICSFCRQLWLQFLYWSSGPLTFLSVPLTWLVCFIGVYAKKRSVATHSYTACFSGAWRAITFCLLYKQENIFECSKVNRYGSLVLLQIQPYSRSFLDHAIFLSWFLMTFFPPLKNRECVCVCLYVRKKKIMTPIFANDECLLPHFHAFFSRTQSRGLYVNKRNVTTQFYRFEHVMSSHVYFLYLLLATSLPHWM